VSKELEYFTLKEQHKNERNGENAQLIQGPQNYIWKINKAIQYMKKEMSRPLDLNLRAQNHLPSFLQPATPTPISYKFISEKI